MAPTAVLISLPTTNKIMNSTTTTNVSTSSVTSRATVSLDFGVYQQTSIGFSDISIRTLVLDAISAETYRKTLIVRPIFHQIMNLSDTPLLSFSDLMSTIALYVGINVGSTEKEAVTTAIFNRNAFFLVFNLQGIDFSDVFGKTLTIPDPVRRPVDHTFFTFRSVVYDTTVDIRTPVSSLSLEFSL